jgi:uncharacterized membrane protein
MNLIQVVFGLILALFLPGYLIARTFFRELSELERVALAFVLSISIDIFLGLFLGYNETMKNITGGITAFNLWVYLGLITVILFSVYLYKEHDEFMGFMKWMGLKKINLKERINGRDLKRLIHPSIIIVLSVLVLIFLPKNANLFMVFFPVIVICFGIYLIIWELFKKKGI